MMAIDVTDQRSPLAVSIEEAARLSGLSKYTIRAYERRGLIKATRIGRRVLIPIDELKRVLRDGVNSGK
jgi:excisionase family DNA binding protein